MKHSPAPLYSHNTFLKGAHENASLSSRGEYLL